MARTRIVHLDPERVPRDELAGIAGALLDGAVAAYPTETFYALGAAAFSRKAVDRIFRLKGRDASKPLSFIASGMDMVRELVSMPPPSFLLLAGELWPGPLTLVLPAADGLPDRLLGPGRTIALRVPPLAWLRSLVGELGGPLTATSANRSGQRELEDAGEVRALFEGRIDLLIDGGPAPGGRPSTIVDLAGGRPRVLREGRIPVSRIEALLGG